MTLPLAAPNLTANFVSGHRNPFAAKMRVSPATTAPATAARRSDCFVRPVYSKYATHDSIENQASVCTALIAAKATGLRFTLNWIVSPGDQPSQGPGLPQLNADPLPLKGDRMEFHPLRSSQR